ncbi:MAG TPA: efflux transporter outer membrane subunit [Candidatus Binatia bacterium]|nr:efflux transporter outer membrane subunit [Candidatus Binatia bacterium]
MTCRYLLFTVLLILLAGCKVGPNYKRPKVDAPSVYRADPQAAQGVSIAEEKWWTVFEDPELQQLIRTSLAENYDVRIAAARILQAQAALGITRADQFPAITAGASATSQRIPETIVGPATNTSSSVASLSLFWELDFWGKFRRATEAARANLLATEWGQRAVITSLVSSVASAYYQLRELDLEMEISRQTLATRQESLRLVKVRQQGGVTSMMDVRQSEQLVYFAAASIPDLERRIEQQENFISVLIGKNPGPIARGKPLRENAIRATVPVGLPSTLLERRPDIQQAEHLLVAANARIGVAKAAYFPQIALTGTGGYQSTSLANLFSVEGGFWNAGAQLAQPIFEGGRIRSGVRLTEAKQQEAALFYKQTIQLAFREVSDSLVAYTKNQESRQQEELLAQAAEDATRLSNARYTGGAASYLEVLDSDTRYFSARLNLAQAVLNERLALVQLYSALGGGWQQ